jgi:hypothetical protein
MEGEGMGKLYRRNRQFSFLSKESGRKDWQRTLSLLTQLNHSLPLRVRQHNSGVVVDDERNVELSRHPPSVERKHVGDIRRTLEVVVRTG